MINEPEPVAEKQVADSHVKNTAIKEGFLLVISFIIGLAGWWLYGKVLSQTGINIFYVLPVLIAVFCFHLALASWIILLVRKQMWIVALLAVTIPRSRTSNYFVNL